jgi:cytidylate kinase
MTGFEQVVTVDGASGSGKSTVLVALRERYGADATEFGPVVRTIAWWARQRRIPVVDAVALLARLDAGGKLSIAESPTGALAASEVVLAGAPMRQRVFSGALSDALAVASADAAAIAWVSGLVRARLRGRRAVLSGRQAADAICPEAGLRIRLEASSSIRATRKRSQLAAAGLRPHWIDDVRLLGPPRNVGLLIDTTDLNIDTLKDRVFREVESKLGWRPLPTNDAKPKLVLPSGLSIAGAPARPLPANRIRSLG